MPETITLGAAQIAEARGWLADCHIEGGMHYGLTDRTILAMVGRHYTGGLAAFAADTAALAD